MATKYIRTGGGNWNDNATWSLSSGGPADTTAPTSADDVITDSNSGTSTVNANMTVKSFVQAGTPGIVTNGGFTLTVTGTVTLLAGKYVSHVSGGITLTGAGTFTSGGNACQLLTVSAVTSLGDNLTGAANKTCNIVLTGNFLNLNGKTISGNSATNRLLISSNAIGTSRTVTVAGGTFANCDFRDIAFANGGADLDLSGITGGSGNCGGNAMSGGGTLTLTAPTTQTFANSGGSFSDIAKWTSRVPLPQDLLRFQPMASAGQTITVDIPRIGDIDFSGCGSTNLPTVNLTTTGLTYEAYGSVNLTGVGTLSRDKTITFYGRSNASLTTAGLPFSGSSTTFATHGATFTLNDAFTSANSFFITNGTVSTNYSVTAYSFNISAGAFLNMGSGNFVITTQYGFSAANGTINAGTSTILLTYTGALATTFAGGTNTYNDITIAPGSGVLTFSGAFTFRNMTMSSAGTRSIVFTKATTYTQTGTSFLSGTASNLITIASNTAGEAFTLSKASGLIASNFLAIKDSIATGGAVWLAGYNSTNISGNTGWHFNSPASGAGVIEFVGSATAKALCRGIPAAAEIVFTAAATAKALCRAAGSGVIEFVGTCSAIVAAWKTTGLFKATERYIGQYFKASKRR